MDDVAMNITTDADNYFTGPCMQRAPPAHRLEPEYTLGHSDRHVPTKHFVEPKVLSPHKTRPGQIPRRIEVERKKRNFVTVDITEALRSNGVIAHLVSTLSMTKKDSIESMSLSMFYNSDFDSRTLESWIQLADESELMGRAMFVKHVREATVIEWRICKIVGASDGLFDVQFCDEKSKGKIHEHKSDPVPIISERLDRLFICFDAEDPENYCVHLLDAMRRKSETASSVALNLYVDCMPMDGLKELNSEQISRILESAVNTDSLRQNPFLDTNALLQQFNMNHMRTLNQLILSNLLRTRLSDIKMVKIASTNVDVFQDPNVIFQNPTDIHIPCDSTFAERINTFKFNSLWNKPEPVTITLQLCSENVSIQCHKFYTAPEKTVRMDEFSQIQLFAANTMATAVTENW